MLYEGCQCVGDISKRLKIPHNLVSFHLKSLVNANLLERRRDGNKSFYSIKKEKMEYVAGLLDLSK
jgi:DNA-binding transcriptional ArsR family regulator